MKMINNMNKHGEKSSISQYAESKNYVLVKTEMIPFMSEIIYLTSGVDQYNVDPF